MDYDYFMDEVRDGFLITSMMKRNWYVSLQTYNRFCDICDFYSTNCSITSGTLLGAIRGFGFIPWDDDIDAEILRVEYRRMISHGLEEKLPAEYWISDDTFSGNGYQIRKLLNNNTYNIPQEKLHENYGFPFANMIDIFMLDYIPDDKEDQLLYFDIIEICETLRRDENCNQHINPEQYQLRLNQLERLFGFSLSPAKDEEIGYLVLRYMDLFMSKYTTAESSNVVQTLYYTKGEKSLIPKHLYNDYVYFPFENGTVRIPAGYDGILRRHYSNYMLPIMNTAFHDYPDYMYIVNTLRENGIELPRYHFDFYSAIHTSTDHIPDSNHSIVFLCYRADHWASLHPLWEEAIKSDWMVTVICTPFYHRDFDRTLREELIDESSLFPKEVKLTPWDTYSFEKEHPHTVVFQCPYDEYSDAFSLPESYYTKNIRPYTERMILIPPFILREDEGGDAVCTRYGVGSYIKTPGIAYADVILTQSEHMKNMYCQILNEFVASDCGENCHIDWEDRILPTGLPLTDWNSRSRILLKLESDNTIYTKTGQPTTPSAYDDVITLPDNWFSLMKAKQGLKKVLIFFIGASVLYEHGTDAVRHGTEMLETISTHKDECFVLWMADPIMEQMLRFLPIDVICAYRDLTEAFRSSNYGIYDESNDIDRAVSIGDIFCGDGCMIMNKMRIRKKPILWETPLPYRTNTSPTEEQKIEDTSIAIEGEWNSDVFLTEAIAYTPEDPPSEISQHIWADVISSSSNT